MRWTKHPDPQGPATCQGIRLRTQDLKNSFAHRIDTLFVGFDFCCISDIFASLILGISTLTAVEDQLPIKSFTKHDVIQLCLVSHCFVGGVCDAVEEGLSQTILLLLQNYNYNTDTKQQNLSSSWVGWVGKGGIPVIREIWWVCSAVQ